MSADNFSFTLDGANSCNAAYDFQTKPESLLMRGIYENRLRNYENSDTYIDVILNKTTSIDFDWIGTSFQLINLYHSGKKNAALDLFYKKREALQGSLFEKYFLRIGAGIIPKKQGFLLLEQVLDMFNEEDDEFGYLTTYANLGAYHCRNEEYQEGIKISKDAHVRLNKFGPQNITHCALSLAAAAFIQGDDVLVKRVLRKVIDLPEDSHYAMVAKMISAQQDFVDGKTDAALKEFRLLLEKVTNTPTQNLKSNFFLNFAVAKHCLGECDEEFRQCIDLATENRPELPSKKWLAVYKTIANLDGTTLAFDPMEYRSWS